MFKINEPVMYHGTKGTVKQVLPEDLYIVQLEDGKDYTLSQDLLSAPAKASYSIENLKNIDVLSAFAENLKLVGVDRLTIEDGKVVKFEAKESLEEKIRRYKTAADKKAEEKAKEDWEKENATKKS